MKLIGCNRPPPQNSISFTSQQGDQLFRIVYVFAYKILIFLILIRGQKKGLRTAECLGSRQQGWPPPHTHWEN